MLTWLMSHLRRPRGVVGGLILGMMNVGHGPMTRSVVPRLAVRPDDVVLDIGCGGGAAIALMAETAARVHGVDISETSIWKAARKNRKAVRDGRVVLGVADALHLPFPENTFTLATAFETVYFWERIGDCFGAIHSVLKPGGRFAVTVEAWREGEKTHNFPKIFERLNATLYSAEDLERLMTNAGLVNTTVAKGDKQHWLCVTGYKGGESGG